MNQDRLGSLCIQTPISDLALLDNVSVPGLCSNWTIQEERTDHRAGDKSVSHYSAFWVSLLDHN